MRIAARLLAVLLVLLPFVGPGHAAELDPSALDAARGAHRRCVERLEALEAVRNPLCVALARRDPTMCLRVPPAVQPACRVLAGIRRWRGILLRPLGLLPRPIDTLEQRCPAALPPGVVVDDGPCRRLLLSHVILPAEGGRAEVLVKMVNPFDEVARCDLRVAATHHGHDPQERAVPASVPPRSPLDRRIPIRYDVGTQVEVEMTCEWGP